ncbi:MAG: hypothetical protein COA79_07660 [Planctomycetota bacterium]|nr:MAG: hypothetical protein COA79_07660 [Planctomycetota bacterium]
MAAIIKNADIPVTKEEFNRAYTRVKIAYRKHKGNKIQMAKDLGISYHSVLQALRVYEKLGKKISLNKIPKSKS